MKYRITYKDIDLEDTYVVEIHDRDTPGAVPIEFDAGHIALSPSGESISLEPTIINTTLSFTIIIEGAAHEAIIDELVNAHPRQYYTHLRLNDERIFTGYVDTDELHHPDEDYPYLLSITATAGLATLADYPYRQPDGTPFSGYATLIDHLFNIFTAAYLIEIYNPSDIVLGSSVNVYETRHNHVTEDALAQTRINQNNWIRNNDGGLVEMEFVDLSFRIKDDPDNLRYRSCYEVLMNIITAFPSRFTYEEGRFCIIALDRLKETAFTQFRYRADRSALSPSTYGFHHALECVAPASHQMLSARHRYLKTLKKVIIKYELGHEQNIIKGRGWDYLNSPYYPNVLPITATDNTRLDLNIVVTSSTLDVLSSGTYHHRYVFALTIVLDTYTLRRDFLGLDPISQEPEYGEITWEEGFHKAFIVGPVHNTAVMNQSLHASLVHRTPPIPVSGNIGVQISLEKVIDAVTGETLPANGQFTKIIPGTNIPFNFAYTWIWRAYDAFIGVLSDKADINTAANSFIRYTATVDERSPSTYESTVMIGDDPGTGHGLSRLEIFDGSLWMPSAAWRLNGFGAPAPILQLAVETLGNIRGVTRRIIDADIRAPLLNASTRLTYRGHRYVLTSVNHDTSEKMAAVTGIAILYTPGKSTIKASGVINAPTHSAPGSAPNGASLPSTATPTAPPVVKTYTHMQTGLTTNYIDIPYVKPLPLPGLYTLEQLYQVFAGSMVNTAPLVPVLGAPTRPGTFGIDHANHRITLPTLPNPLHTYYFRWTQ